jgi:hypothetical protein
MPRLAPASRILLVEALSGLQRLRREMARLSQGDKAYNNKKRALQTAIQELQKWLSADAP